MFTSRGHFSWGQAPWFHAVSEKHPEFTKEVSKSLHSLSRVFVSCDAGALGPCLWSGWMRAWEPHLAVMPRFPWRERTHLLTVFLLPPGGESPLCSSPPGTGKPSASPGAGVVIPAWGGRGTRGRALGVSAATLRAQSIGSLLETPGLLAPPEDSPRNRTGRAGARNVPRGGRVSWGRPELPSCTSPPSLSQLG